MNIGILGHNGMVGRLLLKEIVKNKINKCNNIYLNKCLNEKRFFKSKNLFKVCDIIISCMGSEFAEENLERIKKWRGYWIDASSFFRNKNFSTIVLDPINKKNILRAIKNNRKNFSGGNCTVSLMLMALRGLIKKKNISIEEIHCNTYQAISGAGFKIFNEFINQNRVFINKIKKNSDFIENKIIKKIIFSKNFPKKKIGFNLAFSLVPWIDDDLMNGNSKEEEKASFETGKILGKKIPIFSTCVRVNNLRCHSQSIILKINKNISVDNFTKIISKSKYTKIVKNNKSETSSKLNPINVQGSKKIYIGRIRKVKKKWFSIFTIGDQLIWGANEPIIRLIKIINKYDKS